MRRPRATAAVATGASAVLAVGLFAGPHAGAAPAGTARPAARATAGRYVLSATSDGASYAPTFTGNGYLAVRVPPAGQGYAGGTIPALSELAGFYAKPPKDVQQRANLPTWSTLRFGDGRGTFGVHRGRITRWRQSIDLHDGEITTRIRWHAPDGRVTDLTYTVLTDRADEHVGLVRLRAVPHWNGHAALADIIDGTPATLTQAVTRRWLPAQRSVAESVRTQGTGIVAGLATNLRIAGSKPGAAARIAPANRQSVGQRIGFPVQSGHSYTVTKYVGVTSTHESAHPLRAARREADRAYAAGWSRLVRANDAAWHRLWAGRVDVLGDPTLATEVNASEFYLWSSTRAGSDWSISPAGLSSNGYDGHIFWDAETWMHPSLLAQHPALAAGMDRYRFERLGEARRHARRTGNRGARFPWESALDGTEQIPPPVSVNSEGLYEQHITADIALAQWQYYLATGDRRWLRTRGWPVLQGAAGFWAGRAVRTPDGRYHIRHVTGPDEENPDVTDEAYTNVAAARTLRIASAAAKLLGMRAPASWRRIAGGLVVPYDRNLGIHPEYRGYYGQLVKQADVTMLQYPWARRMPKAVAQRDLDYYVPRSDPGGPSMSDAINQIDTAALGTPGCASYVYTERSIQPFMRDAFDQFSETSTGGAFTFMTGIGGFLQEFLYGWSGLRMHPHSVSLSPSLAGAISGLRLHRLRWHGRAFTVAVGRRTTRVTLVSGAALPVREGGTRHLVTTGRPLTIRTRRPAADPTPDVVRCARASASSAARGMIPLAAVDGSPATGWQPTQRRGQLTVRLARTQSISHASVRWGRRSPAQPKPNVHPPAKPVLTLRPTAYRLLVSTDGTHWRVVTHVRTTGKRVVDDLSFPAEPARYVRIRILSSTPKQEPPVLDELSVTG
jgi:trehalose/maltose hydrolase-like predicted phosphorylase